MRPVVLVLEDLQWGDRPSVVLVESALAKLEGLPLTVLGLARPEVRDAFPDLFRIEGLFELSLPRLPRRRCEELVLAIIDDAAPDTVARLVERADGNPFFLEELIRAEAEGRSSAPATVLATVQARLEASQETARRVQRAASVLGSCFWPSALAGLGPDPHRLRADGARRARRGGVDAARRARHGPTDGARVRHRGGPQQPRPHGLVARAKRRGGASPASRDRDPRGSRGPPERGERLARSRVDRGGSRRHDAGARRVAARRRSAARCGAGPRALRPRGPRRRAPGARRAPRGEGGSGARSPRARRRHPRGSGPGARARHLGPGPPRVR